MDLAGFRWGVKHKANLLWGPSVVKPAGNLDSRDRLANDSPYSESGSANRPLPGTGRLDHIGL